MVVVEERGMEIKSGGKRKIEREGEKESIKSYQFTMFSSD